MPTIAEYNDDLFLMAWGRVMANFANLPRLLQAELDPFREKVMSAAKHGHPCINLAAQINDIASRHAFARLLPFDLDSDLLKYIIEEGFQPGDRLPTINELQEDNRLGISISKAGV